MFLGFGIRKGKLTMRVRVASKSKCASSVDGGNGIRGSRSMSLRIGCVSRV